MGRIKKQLPNAQQRELNAAWEKMKAQHNKPLEKGATAKSVTGSGTKSNMPKLTIPERGTRDIKSFDSGKGNATRQPDKQYTGDAIVGLATMHKSNLVPIFNTEAAKDVAKMRR